MKRFFITFLASSLSILSATNDHPFSSTQQHKSKSEEITEQIRHAKEKRASVFGQLALLNYSDHRDRVRPQTDSLRAFQARKDLNRRIYDREITSLTNTIRLLIQEKKRLDSKQGY